MECLLFTAILKIASSLKEGRGKVLDMEEPLFEKLPLEERKEETS